MKADVARHRTHIREIEASAPVHQGCAPNRRAVLAGAAAVAALSPFQALAQQLPAGQNTPLTLRRPPPPQAAPGKPIEVSAQPITSFDRLKAKSAPTGRLVFRGGLVLQSPEKEFGGWSGIVMSDDGRRLAMVSDRGSWLTGDIGYEGHRPVRLGQAVLGEIPGANGTSLRTRDRDAEAVTLLDGTLSRGTVLVAFERNHRIGRYPISDRGLGAPLGFLKMPADARRMSANKGLEAIVAVRSGPLRGAIIAFAEELHDEARHHTGWMWAGGIGAEAQRLSLTNIGDFAVTDLVALPDGNLVVLERKFRWLEGVKLRLRLVPASSVRPGALLDGEVLLEADMASEIDNMEGLAVSRDQRGGVVLTMVSDNNFNSMLQRTILLQFALAPAGQAAVAR